MMNNKILQCHVENSVDFILSHFKGQEYVFPRTIMTFKTNRQIIVNSKDELMKYFKEANFLDCRINGYPYIDSHYDTRSYPSFIFIDLDLSLCESCKYPIKKLDYILKQTLKRIKRDLDGFPTVLWTGGGYHVYQPIKVATVDSNKRIALDILQEFRNLLRYVYTDVTTEFVRLAEGYFTDNKNDPNHHPSTKSCLIRVPETINSKYNEKVKIIQQWDFKEPDANFLIPYLLDLLTQRKLDYNMTSKKNTFNSLKTTNRINWIENLLDTPIDDHRKYCLWKILVPYLKNIRKLPKDEIITMLTVWLDKCDREKRIDFRYPRKIEEDLKYVRGFLPIGKEKLRNDNFELFRIIRFDA